MIEPLNSCIFVILSVVRLTKQERLTYQLKELVDAEAILTSTSTT